MQTIRSLLVVIEPELMESLALERAKYIARTTKAHLHLLICDKKHEHADLLSVPRPSSRTVLIPTTSSCCGTI